MKTFRNINIKQCLKIFNIMNTNKLIENLLEVIKELPMSNENETVGSDEEKLIMAKEHQWDIYVAPDKNGLVNRLAFDFILQEYVREIVYNCVNIDILKEPGLDWAFIRKYELGARAKLEPHFDNDEYTINIMLSPPEDYDGGEFIYCPGKYHEEGDKLNLTEKHELINRLLKKNIAHKLKPKMGEAIVLIGNHVKNMRANLHCVYPVTKGTRYVLCLFFDKTCKSLSEKLVNLYNNKKLG